MTTGIEPGSVTFLIVGVISRECSMVVIEAMFLTPIGPVH